jgi:hypothetical protein
MSEMKSEFERAVRVQQRIQSSSADLKKFLDDIKAFLGGGRRDLFEDTLLDRLTAEQIDMVMELRQSNAAQVSAAAKRFRDALLGRWGLDGWLDGLAKDIATIKNVLQGRSDFHRGRRINRLYIYGVPAILTAVIYAIGFASGSETPWRISNLSGLFLFVLLYVLVFLFGGYLARLVDWLLRPLRGARATDSSANADPPTTS